MAAAQTFQLTWDHFISNVSRGFSQFQQRQEFVDMTIAVEGYLVKVHQNIMALASPYLKEILTSAPCPHPVIFLSGISHEQLCYILEYIYMGEVGVPCDRINKLIEVGKILHIKGLEDMSTIHTQQIPEPQCEIQPQMSHTNNTILESTSFPNSIVKGIKPTSSIDMKNEEFGTFLNTLDVDPTDNPITNNPEPPTYNLAVDNNIITTQEPTNHIANIVIGSDLNYKVEMTTNLIQHDNSNNAIQIHDMNMDQDNNINLDITRDNDMESLGSLNNDSQFTFNISINGDENLPDLNEIVKELPGSSPMQFNRNNILMSVDQGKNSSCPAVIEKSKETLIVEETTNAFPIDETIKPMDTVPYYSTTNRGSLQLILNRYIYYVHHVAQKGRKKRWRCIDYRNCQCPAFIDSDNEVVVSRKCMHTHRFHDKIIMKKFKSGNIFSNVKDAQESKKKTKETEEINSD